MNDALRSLRSLVTVMAFCALAGAQAAEAQAASAQAAEAPVAEAQIAEAQVAGTQVAGTSLRLGVLPYLPAAGLLRQFGHLKDFLAAEGGIAVQLETAPGYAAFAARLLAGEYDVAFSAPHIALLAVGSGCYLPLARTGHRVRPAIIVRRKDGPRSLAGLAGRTVASPDPIALVTLLGEAHFAAQPALSLRRPMMLYALSHRAAFDLLLRGLADAALSIPLLLERMPASERERLVVLVELDEVFSLVYIVSPRVDAATRARLHALLLRFADSAPGMAFFGGDRSLRNVTLAAGDLAPFEPLLPPLRDRLQAPAAAISRCP